MVVVVVVVDVVVVVVDVVVVSVAVIFIVFDLSIHIKSFLLDIKIIQNQICCANDILYVHEVVTHFI